MCAEHTDRPARDHDFAEEFGASEEPRDRMTLEDLRRVKLNVTADLGTCELTVREVLDLKEGSLLTMNKLAGEMADIFVNGIPLARGEVVVLVDSLHVRVAEIIGRDR